MSDPKRTAGAIVALDAFKIQNQTEDEPDRDNIIDLIANLLYLSASQGLGVEAIHRMALMHWEEETGR